MPFRWLVPQIARLDELDLERIVDAAKRIFRTVPWTIDGTPEFMDLLREFGCEIEGKKVRFTDRAADATLGRILREREAASRLEAPIQAAQEITYAASGQALWCCGIEDDVLRPATKQDLADFCRVANTFPRLGRTHPTFIPTDVPLRTRELHAYVGIMLHSDRPYRVSAFSPEVLEYMVEANTIYYGSKEEGIAHLLLPAKVWVNTPLTISRESIEAAMRLRQLTGKPLTINAMPVSGIATPVTPDGALVLITAEVLGMNAISLAVDNVLPGWNNDPLTFDMKNAIHTQWGPEVWKLAAAGAQIAAYLFGGSPSGIAVGNPTTAAKVPGAQSTAEKAIALGLLFASGIRHFGSLGTLAFVDVGSTVQLMLDMELVSALESLARSFSVSAETLAETVIEEVAPRGAHFLDSDHTRQHFRDSQWFPELMDRRVAGVWKDSPYEMLERARDKAKLLVTSAPNQCPLGADRRQALARLLESADRELAG